MSHCTMEAIIGEAFRDVNNYFVRCTKISYKAFLLC